MPRLITIISIMAFIILLSIGGILYAKDTKANFDNMIDTAIVQCREENSSELLKTAKKLSAFYESRHGFLCFYVRHDDIERVDSDLVSLLCYAEIGLYDNAQLCLNNLKMIVKRIYESELPNSANLF